MFKKTNTVDAVLAQFNKTIAALTEVRDAHIADAAVHEAKASAAKVASIDAQAEAKRADAVLVKLTKLVA